MIRISRILPCDVAGRTLDDNLSDMATRLNVQGVRTEIRKAWHPRSRQFDGKALFVDPREFWEVCVRGPESHASLWRDELRQFLEDE